MREIRHRRSLRRRLPRSVLLALVLAVLFFAGGYAAGQDVQRGNSRSHHSLERIAEPLPGGVGIVTATQVVAAHDDHPLLIDVRSREAFDLSHATGAISMPESEMVRMAESLPRDQTLVFFCTCPDERTSLRAARTMAELFELTNIVVLKGGLDAYEDAGGAVTVAATDLGIESQGCGCNTGAPAFKLWVINNGEPATDSPED
jgi:rhodanese-related sulfurtransferase